MNITKQLEQLQSLRGFFFDTPLVEFNVNLAGKQKKIYAKYESFNFSGSIKDRMAFFIFENAYKLGHLKPKQDVIEVTSGNTGIAITALGRSLGHDVTIVMPDWLSAERYAIMELTGAKLIKVSKEEGGFTASIEIAKKMAQENNMYYPDQFSNAFNMYAHASTTAPELLSQLNKIDLMPQHIVAGVGTGGTVMGFHKFFSDEGIDCKCYPLEPENSPTLRTGGKKIGSHRIQGISDEFIPQLLHLNKLAKIIDADDGESIALARQINKMGLSVGISSGANLLGALQLLEQNPDDVICTVLADSSFKYLTTDLCNNSSDKVSLDKYPYKITGYKVM